jgi:hypothetical protein
MSARFIGRILATFSIVLLLLLPATASADSGAASVLQVAGDFTVGAPEGVSVEPLGRTCRISFSTTFTFTGDLTGAFTAPFSILHLGSCDQPAAEVFQARGTYAGEVAEASGTFEFLFAGTIDATGRAQGQLVVLRGTGGLTTLHGVVQLNGQALVGGKYTGAVTLRS